MANLKISFVSHICLKRLRIMFSIQLMDFFAVDFPMLSASSIESGNLVFNVSGNKRVKRPAIPDIAANNISGKGDQIVP